MPAHEWQVAKHGGRSVESGFVERPTSIKGCFEALATIREAEKADQPFDDAEREAAASRQEAERLANEAFARTPRSVALLAAKRQQEAAQAPAGTMAHAIGKAMAKAKSRDRK